MKYLHLVWATLFCIPFTGVILIACGSEAMADCASLMKVTFPDTGIRQAQPVARGAFRPSDQSGAPVAIFASSQASVASSE
jgi:hypothetical protein